MTDADIIETGRSEPGFGPAMSSIMQYLATFVLTVLASAIAVGVESRIAIPNVSMVYVVPVVIAGAAFGVGPSLFAALLGALSFNYFLTEPRYTLTVDDPANIWAIVLLFLVGLIVSGVAFVSSRKASEAAEWQRRAEILQRFSAEIAAAGSLRQITSSTSIALAALFAAPAVMMVLQEGQLHPMEGAGSAALTKAELEAAASALSARNAVHAGVYPDLESRFDFWPVVAGGHAIAVIGVAFPPDERPALAGLSIDVVRGVLALAISRQDAGRTGEA